MEQQTNQPHRDKHSGPSAQKKKSQQSRDQAAKQNPKGFAVGKRAEKQARRTADVDQKKLHVPLVDRSPDEAPPVIIAVVGPPGTGKTTLIKSLVKRFSKHSLTEVRGPITVVSGKHRRLTFIECANDLNAMMDVAKIADLVLLLIDGNFGFEMETMEFLNILAPHGMPKVMGILTHLDLFKKPATLRTAKKRLKQRFWTEIYQGAKLFYLSGVINGRYPDREILNLCRFISVMKFRPLLWRNSHPYLLADRVEDLTPPQQIQDDPTCDRTITLYGYARGTNFSAQDARIHIPGVGDLTANIISALPDPCPAPGQEKGKKRRTLGEKAKLIYGPLSDVGGITFDKDAVYIDMPTNSFSHKNPQGEEEDSEDEEETGFGERLVMGLQGAKTQEAQGLQLFSGGGHVTDSGRRGLRQTQAPELAYDDVAGLEDVPTDDEQNEDDDVEPPAFVEKMDRGGGRRETLQFADSDSEIGALSGDEENISYDEEEGEEEGEEDDASQEEDDMDDDTAAALRWKDGLAEKATADYMTRRPRRLAALIYDLTYSAAEVVQEWTTGVVRGTVTTQAEEESDDEADDFFKVTADASAVEVLDASKPKQGPVDSTLLERVRSRFIPRNPEADLDPDATDNHEEELFGDFEDLEASDAEETVGDAKDETESAPAAPLDFAAERLQNEQRKAELKQRFEEEDDRGGKDEEAPGGELDWHDQQKAKIAKQLELNKEAFAELTPEERISVEGHRPGSYLRLQISGVPCEFIQSFTGKLPVVVGGLLANEQSFGLVQVRIKKHRWHKKILKTNDPLILSIGWRRFQTLPLYSTSDNRTRNRLLKYTPEHMHCFATFYGPLTAPNIGFCAFRSVANNTPGETVGAGFRVAATGTVLDLAQSSEIVKKLKLTGTPYKIFKNTAFIKDMFTSSLEVAKFEGANLRTVSGIRGQVKKALRKPEGHFRATFEDKVLMSDIVFLRAWYPITPRRYYNPVTSLLEAGNKSWQGMRLTGVVRHAMSLETPLPADSQYRKIERPERRFNPLRVPRGVQASLPFASKPARMVKQGKQTYLQKRAVVLGGEEKKARDLLQKLMTVRNDKTAKREKKQEERRVVHRQAVAKEAAFQVEKEKKKAQAYYKEQGKKRRIEGGKPVGNAKKRARED